MFMSVACNIWKIYFENGNCVEILEKKAIIIASHKLKNVHDFYGFFTFSIVFSFSQKKKKKK
jgi:hypothetical protein